MKKTPKLTFEERVQIRTHLEHQLRPAQIAKKLDRHRSTISRELNLWGIKDNYEDYNPSLAHTYCREGYGIIRRFEFKLIKHPFLQKLVIRKLKLRWSPQQIDGYLKRKFPKNKDMQVSHESIYKYIYTVARGALKKELISYLRYSKSKRKSNVGSRKSSIRIKDRISIDYRPKEVDDRVVPGHWESDLIIGKDRKTAIGTIVERKTRFTILVPLKNRTAVEVRKAFARELKKLPKELHVYENAVAERVNGILKGEFDIDIGFGSLKEARAVIAQSIYIYNNKRRHLSLHKLTPNFVHFNPGIKIKTYKKSIEKPENS